MKTIFCSSNANSARSVTFVSVLMLLLFCPANRAYCQNPTVETATWPYSHVCAQPVPRGWQQNTASLIETYKDVKGDTAISRTCGSSLSSTCVQGSGSHGRYYTFVVRDRNNGINYRAFRTLEDEVDTVVNFQGQLIEHRTRYYIRDMRTADSMCFFCGMMVVEYTLLPIATPEIINIPVERTVLSVDSTGFLGRFSMASIMTPTLVGERPDDGIGAKDESMHDNLSLSSNVDIFLAQVNECSVLEKMWIDEGLYMDMLEQMANQACPTMSPFTWDSVYYDTSFPIDSVQAFIIGRLKVDSKRSCLINVKNIIASTNNYYVYVSPMREEVFYDITGLDARVLLLSHFKGSEDGEFTISYQNDFYSGFSNRKTIGVRFLDLYRNQAKDNNCGGVTPWIASDYRMFDELHLYQSENRIYGDGHLCRMKNTPVATSAGKYFRNQDFCILARFNSTLGLIHVDRDMNPVYSFYVDRSDMDGHEYCTIADVVCVGNTLTNSLAIAYKNWPCIDLVDWGTQMVHGFGWRIDDYSPSVHLSRLQMNTTSLDMYHNGSMLLVGGIDQGALGQIAQRKNVWTDIWRGLTTDYHNQPDYNSCLPKFFHNFGSNFHIDHRSFDFGLVNYLTGYDHLIRWTIHMSENIVDNKVEPTCLKNMNED